MSVSHQRALPGLEASYKIHRQSLAAHTLETTPCLGGAGGDRLHEDCTKPAPSADSSPLKGQLSVWIDDDIQRQAPVQTRQITGGRSLLIPPCTECLS